MYVMVVIDFESKEQVNMPVMEYPERNATGKIEKPALRKRYGSERLVEKENQS